MRRLEKSAQVGPFVGTASVEEVSPLGDDCSADCTELSDLAFCSTGFLAATTNAPKAPSVKVESFNCRLVSIRWAFQSDTLADSDFYPFTSNGSYLRSKADELGVPDFG